MRGRVWLVLGALAGVAIALGQVPYVAGAARSLAETAERLVGSGGHRLLVSAAGSGAPRKVVMAATALVAVALPGITALLAVVAAKGTLRIRAVICVALVALGAAAFAYQGHGVAGGALALAIAVAGVAAAATGPLVVAPLAALAGLLCGETLPRILDTTTPPPGAPVDTLHQALFSTSGSPGWLQAVVLVVAAVPFAFAAKLVFGR